MSGQSRLDGQMFREACVLVETIKPLLAGKSSGAVGTALGQLCADFIAGHAPPLRTEQRELLSGLIDELVPVALGQMIAEGHAPEG